MLHRNLPKRKAAPVPKGREGKRLLSFPLNVKVSDPNIEIVYFLANSKVDNSQIPPVGQDNLKSVKEISVSVVRLSAGGGSRQMAQSTAFFSKVIDCKTESTKK